MAEPNEIVPLRAVDKLTPKQLTFAEAVAIGRSPTDLRREMQIPLGEFRAWQNDKTFRQAVDELRAEVFDRSYGTVLDFLPNVLNDLRDIAGNALVDPRTRVAAIRTLLEWTSKTHEIQNLEARIQRLEEDDHNASRTITVTPR